MVEPLNHNVLVWEFKQNTLSDSCMHKTIDWVPVYKICSAMGSKSWRDPRIHDSYLSETSEFIRAREAEM